MADPLTILPGIPKRIGVAADHGGFELKGYIVERLRQAGYKVTEFGNRRLKLDDDYPDFVIPLARAVARLGTGQNISSGAIQRCRAPPTPPG